MVETHKKKHSDLSIRYFPNDLSFSFDSLLIGNPSFWEFVYSTMVKRWVDDRMHQHVTQISIGEMAYPIKNISQARFVFFSSKDELYQILLNDFPSFFHCESELFQIYRRRYDSNLGRYLLGRIRRSEKYSLIESNFWKKHGVIPSFGSISLVKKDKSDLSDVFTDIFKTLFCIYTEYYPPDEKIEEIIEKYLPSDSHQPSENDKNQP